jgi:hypothetical protein
MLRDADLSLANWFEGMLPPGTGVRFDAPRADWQQQGRGAGAGFLSAFLCEVSRDGRDLPPSGWSEVRNGEGRLVGRQAAPRYYRLAYLVTAWAAAAGAEQDASRRTIEEHELLGALIDACTNTDILEDDHLTGTLAEAGLPSFVRCAIHGPGPSAVQGLWSGFGIAPRAHLVLELVAPVVPTPVTDLAPPTRQIVLDAQQLPGPGPSGDAAAAADTPAGRAPGGPGGAVRRWERSTIIERAGGPRPPGSAAGPRG